MTDQSVSQNVVPVGGEFRIDPHGSTSVLPSITNLADGRFIVLWRGYDSNYGAGLYGQFFHVDGSPDGDRFAVNTTPYSEWETPSVAALDDGGFVVTWGSRAQAGAGFDIRCQVFNTAGSPVGDEFMVSTPRASDQMSASATGLGGGGFVVTWMSENQDSGGRDGYSWGIYGRLYDSAGSPVGSEIHVNTYVSYAQLNPIVSKLAGGGFVVAWMSLNQDPGGDFAGWGVYCQVYSSNGIPVGSEFRVNSYTEGLQDFPDITGLSGGGFAVAWRSRVTWNIDNQDGSGNSGIFCQVYNADGSVAGSEFRVNTYTIGEQVSPAISSLADGGFVVTWTSEGQDGDSSGVYGQIYNSDGSPQGGEFQVNTYTVGSQSLQSITGLSDGGFCVAWTSLGQGGSGWGVYGQLFSPVNFVPVGSVLASGSATQAQVLSANIAGVMDEDGINPATLTYQWLRGGTVIANATGETYTLTQADVGSQISVKFGYTDNFGTQESVTSGATAVVGNVNDAAAGSVLVSGTVNQGQVLSANAAGVTDADGINAATISYQWLRGGTVIANATGETYTLTQADVGSAISVRFGYTDNFGTQESVTSAATALVQRSTFNGTAGADVLTGNALDNSLDGLAGNDSLYGGLGSDILNGGDGNDMLDGGAGVDTAEFTTTAAIKVDLSLSGKQSTGQGTDTITNIENVTSGSGADVLKGSSLDNALTAGDGNDQLFGSSGNDSLYAEAGNDTLQGDAGDDYLDGGLGTDTATYTGSTVTTVDLTLINPQNTGQGSDTLINIENIFSGAGADILIGNILSNILTSGDGNDQLTGHGGSDSLYGGNGNDVFDAATGDGNDVLDGGAGIDTLLVASGSLTLDLSLTTAQATGFGTDKFLNIENVTSGDDADVLRGSSAANAFTVNGGNDLLIGGAGNDSLYGGADADTLQGDLGNDILDGGAGIDTASFIGTTAVKVDLSLIVGQVTGLGTDTLTNIENVTSGSGADVLKGSSLDNVLTSGGGNDQLFGALGNDNLYAEAGNDTLQGDAGDDYLDGGIGSDTAVFVGAAATVDLALLTAQDTGHGLDTFANIENVTSGSGADVLYGNAVANILTGNDGTDLLSGNDGNDTLFGGTGNDTLHGGAGNDALTGGAGSDVFVFNTGDGRDSITDFLNGTDRFQIADGAESFGQVTVADSGRNVLITFSDVTITLMNVDHRLIGVEDFIFV